MIREQELRAAKTAYDVLNALPSAHLLSLDDRTRNAILDSMAQLRVLMDSLARPVVVANCGYSSPTRCPHSRVTG